MLNQVVSSLQKLCCDNSNSLADQLFMLIILGDDRNIYRTYVNSMVGFIE